jgi:DNA-binding transcriptional ArsR family regulator
MTKPTNHVYGLLYNTLVKTNMFSDINKLSDLLTCLSQPTRIQLIFALSNQEACVCHLEYLTQMKQASISQHLNILRKYGIVDTRRDGKHIYYHLCNPLALVFYTKVAEMTGMDTSSLLHCNETRIPECPCPVCNPDLDPKQICKKIL